MVNTYITSHRFESVGASPAQKVLLLFGDGVDEWDNFVKDPNASTRACQAQVVLIVKKRLEGHMLHSPREVTSEGDGLYAIKGRCGLRVWFFDVDGQMVVVHCNHKKSDKVDKRDKNRALANKKLFESERKSK